MADTSYPGDEATPEGMQALADEYRKAAKALRQRIVPGERLSRAPFHLTAIHAVELYLDAFLLKRGRTPSYIRRLQHDLGKRAELAIEGQLSLRKGTVEHLCKLSDSREYVVSRYAPELVAAMSELNRLEATLDDVAEKVSKAGKIVASSATPLSARYSPRA
jgi:hypothetical protein